MIFFLFDEFSDRVNVIYKLKLLWISKIKIGKIKIFPVNIVAFFIIVKQTIYRIHPLKNVRVAIELFNWIQNFKYILLWKLLLKIKCENMVEDAVMEGKSRSWS